MIDEKLGFIIIIILIAILLLWPTINNCRMRVAQRCQSEYKPCMLRPQCNMEGLEQKDIKLDSDRPMVEKDETYGQYVEQEALDPSVFESQRRYTTDSPHRTTVSSSDTVRDDPNDVNPWVGLRRPVYNSPFARNHDQSRIVSSEEPDQMPINRSFLIN